MLVPAICPNCGGTLKIDDKQEAAVCKYCSTPFISEKAINNYITQNNTYIENATFVNKDSAETLLQKGITQIKIGKYEDAVETFDVMSKEYPENWKAWFGLALTNFYLYPEEGFVIEDGIYSIIPDEVQDEIHDELAPVEIVDIERLEKKINKTRINIDVLIEDKDNVDYELAKTDEEYKALSNMSCVYIYAGFVGGVVMILLGIVSMGTMPMVGILCIIGALYIIYWLAFKKNWESRPERIELSERIGDLEKEQKHLMKKIESGENKYNQLISDQDALNALLDDKLTQKGVSTTQEYYLNILLDN